jgi:hypothetical protein
MESEEAICGRHAIQQGEDGGCMCLRNTGVYLQADMELQPNIQDRQKLACLYTNLCILLLFV